MKILSNGIAVLENDDWISKWVIDSGKLAHDEYLLPLILPHIPVGGTVLDIGANIGSHTIAYLEKVGPHGKVHAFEPNAKAVQCLRHNCPAAIIHYNALSDREGILELEHSEDKTNIGAYRIGKGAQVCHAITLDSLNLRQVDFAKFDCEGFEMFALRGAEETINACRPRLLVEVNRQALARFGFTPSDITDWLRQHHYEWKPIQEVDVATALQFDILCLPDVALRAETPPTLEQKREETGVPLFVSRQPPSVTPWENKAESLAVIKYHAESLKHFCKAPLRTKAVRDALRESGVIK